MTQPFKHAEKDPVRFCEVVSRTLTHAGISNTHLVECSVSGECSSLSPGLRESLLLALNECAENTVRHARATWVRVSITCRGADAVDLSFADDGRGCDIGVALSYALGGLAAMRRRVEVMGGRAAFSSPRGGGFFVFLQLGSR